MGSWSVYCSISNISITSGNRCALLPLKKNNNNYGYFQYIPAALPIFGIYNDYGSMEGIEENENTKLIEEHFGISIDEFVTFLVDGKFTYERDEAEEVEEKLKENGMLDEIKNWRFMFIDGQVYDFMKNNHDNHEKGYMDYGTSDMLGLMGFELIKESDSFKNYDPKRFNQLWKKGDVEFYSDGRTLLTTDKGRYVYHFGKGCESSLETYFEVPQELHYLKEKTKHEAWKVSSETRKNLGFILGKDRYDSFLDDDYVQETLDILLELPEDKKDEDVKKTIKKYQDKIAKRSKTLLDKYIKNIDSFGDSIVELINMRHNMYAMSGDFTPHTLYLTPQCGEHRHHQLILEKFVEINKSYCQFEDDEDDE